LNEFLCGIKDVISKVKVEEGIDRTRRELNEMEIKKATGKELYNWYDKEYKVM